MLLTIIIFFIVVLIYLFGKQIMIQVNQDQSVVKLQYDFSDEKIKELEIVISKEISYRSNDVFFRFIIDIDNNRFVYFNILLKVYNIIQFNEIIDCNIVENDTMVSEGGVGRALVGGAIAGEAGAIVGAVTRKDKQVLTTSSIRVITSNILNPYVNIQLINNRIKATDPIYERTKQTSQEIYSTIRSVIEQQKKI